MGPDWVPFTLIGGHGQVVHGIGKSCCEFDTTAKITHLQMAECFTAVQEIYGMQGRPTGFFRLNFRPFVLVKES